MAFFISLDLFAEKYSNYFYEEPILLDFESDEAFQLRIMDSGILNRWLGGVHLIRKKKCGYENRTKTVEKVHDERME
jgi:hypothetical protein